MSSSTKEGGLPVAIPAGYDGREQALIKHVLLEQYLLKLFLIMGSTGRGRSIELCYIDCFAGPWGDDSEAMTTTSIAISLRTLEACREKLAELGVMARMRALYIEQDPKAYERLSKYLSASCPKEIHAEAWPGDFVALRGDILKWTGTSSFAFFFIDPKGWTPVGIPVLKNLLARPRSEFLITFMYNDVNRTMAMADWQPIMSTWLDQALDLSHLDPAQREDRILRAYREGLIRCVPSAKARYRARTAYARVLDPHRNRPKYHLVYLTTHPRGIIEFMSLSELCDQVQKRVRAIAKVVRRERSTGISDLFGVQDATPPEQHHSGDVDTHWRKYLSSGSRRVGLGEFADIIEETDYFPGDLQASLSRLIESRVVVNHDSARRRPKKPLHFWDGDGELLELVSAPK